MTKCFHCEVRIAITAGPCKPTLRNSMRDKQFSRREIKSILLNWEQNFRAVRNICMVLAQILKSRTFLTLICLGKKQHLYSMPGKMMILVNSVMDIL